jgi:hypothetical protein
MLKHKNVGFYDLDLVVPGTMSATLSGRAGSVAPFAGFISNIHAKVFVPQDGTISTKLDVNKNSTTIFAAETTQISLAGTTGVASYGALTTDPIQVAAGDLFTVDVDVPGVGHVGCIVRLTVDRQNPGQSTTLSDLSAKY